MSDEIDTSDGWAFVPRSASPEMVIAWEHAYDNAPQGSGVAGAWEYAWQAMLDARPKPPEPVTYPAGFDVMPGLERISENIHGNDHHLFKSAMLEIWELRKLHVAALSNPHRDATRA